MDRLAWKWLRVFLKWRWLIAPFFLVILGIIFYWDPFGWMMLRLPWLDGLIALILIGGGILELVAYVIFRLFGKKDP